MNATVNDFKQEKTTQIFDIQEGQDEFSSTFIFGNEDHTFGNPLRHILMQKTETDFCGYSVPHPYEPKLNLRLQTKDEPAINVLFGGLTDMMQICDMLETTFNIALQDYSTPSASANDVPSSTHVKGAKKVKK